MHAASLSSSMFSLDGVGVKTEAGKGGSAIFQKFSIKIQISFNCVNGVIPIQSICLCSPVYFDDVIMEVW